MLFKRIKIESANLEPGMFIAQLDRPWLETPFLFHGFEVRDEKDLKQLRHYCGHVYVDVTRSSMPKEKILKAQRKQENYAQKLVRTTARNGAARPVSLRRRILDSLTRLDPTGTLAAQFHSRHYRNVVPTHKEAPRASQAYDTAVGAMNALLAQIQDGKGLDMPQVRQIIGPMIDSVLRNQDAMAWVVYLRKRDEYTYQHSIASSVWAVILGRHLGFDRQALDNLALGGMLLDIGKAKIPREITLKPGRLDDIEFAMMKKHVGLGLAMVRSAPGVTIDVLTMIESHHERHDGSGYPKGLAGADIPVFGRIAGIVDCFDAMTTRRPYAPAKSSYDAIRELNGLSGTLFQRELVEQFVQALGMFPTGSLVELNTGEVAIVVEQNRVRRLRPKLMLVLDANKAPLATRQTIDLRKLPSDESQRNARWVISGLEPGAFGLDPKDYFI